jgi:hypothetical protein
MPDGKEFQTEMSAAMWKKEDGSSPQPTPTLATHTDALNKFTKSATAFMEHVHLLTEAREAYQEAMTASAALRSSLDAGDKALRSLMAQLEQVVSAHLGEPPVDKNIDKKKMEPAKVEPIRSNNDSIGAVRTTSLP